MRRLLVSLVVATALGTACGDDPVSVSLSGTTTTRDAVTTTTEEATTTSESAVDERPRGCSSSRPSSTNWPGAAVDPATGVVTVDAFNAFLATATEPVATSPCDAARVFVKADALGEGGDAQIEVSPDDAASANVTVTVTGLEDDSVAAERWVLQFAEQADGTIRLAAAQRTVRCHPGRGHQDFSTVLCV